MKFDEFKVLAKGMKAVYAQPTFLPDADALKIWYHMLKDLDYKVANAAIQKFMLTSKFPPTIADIREQAAAVSVGEKPLWSDGWDSVLKAIKKYGSYNQAAAMQSFDPITRQCVERLGYMELCLSTNIMADRANFRMIFDQLSDRQQKALQMPMGLNELIGEIQRKELPNESKRLSASNPQD